MVSNTFFTAAVVLATAGQVFAHITLVHPSMWGYNESEGGHRMQDPIMNQTFHKWWFHGLIDQPPHREDVFQLPVGQPVTTELACNRGLTSYWRGAPGGDIRDLSDPNNPCPRAPIWAYHTNGKNEFGGCALAVAYKSNAYDVKPEDFTVFSVNHTCAYYRFTDFQIPAQMPKCPNDLCICSWHWQHLSTSGSQQMYFTPFQCNMQGATSTTPLPPAKPPRRCGVDAFHDRPADPGNCTYGAKQPFYWYQADGNNMFEGTYEPPTYGSLFGYNDGPQEDLFDPAFYNHTRPHYNISTDTAIVPAPSPILMKTFPGIDSLNNNNKQNIAKLDTVTSSSSSSPSPSPSLSSSPSPSASASSSSSPSPTSSPPTRGHGHHRHKTPKQGNA